MTKYEPVLINWYCPECDKTVSSQDVLGMTPGKAKCAICGELVERVASRVVPVKEMEKDKCQQL